MRILIVNGTTEGQADIAERIRNLDPRELGTLDLHVSLASPLTYLEKLVDVDVVVFGPELVNQVPQYSNRVKDYSPEAEIIVLVSQDDYESGAFRLAHAARARKVLPINASEFDLLQELVTVREEGFSCGKRLRGQVVAVTHAKGGIGATTFVAGLGCALAQQRRRTLLWDLDIETCDLARSLNANGLQARKVSQWISSSMDVVDKELFKEGLFRLNPFLNLLMPPDQMPAAMDLVGHPNSLGLISSILELARTGFESVVIDLAGRLSAASGSILLAADKIIVVTDDSVLGITSTQQMLGYFSGILPDLSKVRLLCSGISLEKAEMMEAFEDEVELTAENWSLPQLHFDKAAAKWPGSGGSLYELGSRRSRAFFERTLDELKLSAIANEEQQATPLRLGQRGRKKSFLPWAANYS